MARLRKTGKIWHMADADGGGRLVAACTGYFTIEPNSLFGRAAPLEVEIGAGRGDFILGRAAAMPERNFLAVEVSAPLAHLLAARATRAELQNLRIARIDARPLVNLFLPGGSVSAYHVYFPDPWPKARHAKHRLFTPWFVANLMRTMIVGASLYIATDVPEYAELIFSMANAQGLRPTSNPVAGAAATGFARKFIAQGRTFYSRAFAR
ncbi:MAG: tRNA (guanosine(46)-N7)-methyltransferase TrmB [Deltaproteobacteria bacterium]|nr:tRNA (guanosine(46)-N7)-methyltransferase TrmB [Deltaproteobacteria bacterium]